MGCEETEIIYLVDQDKIRGHNTFIRIHSDYPCSAGGCEETGKGLRVKQLLRSLDAEASSKNKYTARATLAKRVSKHNKNKNECASIVQCKVKNTYK